MKNMTREERDRFMECVLAANPELAELVRKNGWFREPCHFPEILDYKNVISEEERTG